MPSEIHATFQYSLWPHQYIFWLWKYIIGSQIIQSLALQLVHLASDQNLGWIISGNTEQTPTRLTPSQSTTENTGLGAKPMRVALWEESEVVKHMFWPGREIELPLFSWWCEIKEAWGQWRSVQRQPRSSNSSSVSESRSDMPSDSKVRKCPYLFSHLTFPLLSLKVTIQCLWGLN